MVSCCRDEESAYRRRERWRGEMWFLVVGMMGLSIARKVASRDVVCCREEERVYIARKVTSRSRRGLPMG